MPKYVGCEHPRTRYIKLTAKNMISFLRNIAVLGAGLMGAGICQVSLKDFNRVVMKDAFSKGLVRGQNQIDGNLNKDLKKKKIDAFQKDRLMSTLLPTLDYSWLRDADMIIEAVFEDIHVGIYCSDKVDFLSFPDAMDT